jgi:hypothetical protein
MKYFGLLLLFLNQRNDIELVEDDDLINKYISSKNFKIHFFDYHHLLYVTFIDNFEYFYENKISLESIFNFLKKRITYKDFLNESH